MPPNLRDLDDPPLEDPKPLRPLASLKWPYVPEESAYPDPLKRDDPKTLQLHHYEAIATSPAVREILADNAGLQRLLSSVDGLRGVAREEALQRALGVSTADLRDFSQPTEVSDDVGVLRRLAEAIEACVRGEQQGVLGLNWDANE